MGSSSNSIQSITSMQLQAEGLSQTHASAASDASTQANTYNASIRSASMKENIAQSKVDVARDELNPPPTTTETRGSGKDMQTVTVVDEKEKAKLEKELAAAESQLNTAKMEGDTARQAKADFERLSADNSALSEEQRGKMEAMKSLLNTVAQEGKKPSDEQIKDFNTKFKELTSSLPRANDETKDFFKEISEQFKDVRKLLTGGSTANTAALRGEGSNSPVTSGTASEQEVNNTQSQSGGGT